MLPMFKKSHINTRAIEDYIQRGTIKNYSEDSNKRNALKQASLLYKMVDGDLYRHGSGREYAKYGLRVVVHDDEPQRKLDIISKCHLDEMGNHYGMNNTIKNVNKLYYWHGLSAHVKMFLKKCEQCKERSKFSMEQWLEGEKNNLSKRKLTHAAQISTEIKNEIKSLGRIRKATPPETFFIVNAHRKVDFDNLKEDAEMLIDSNNIEYVVETLGNSEDGQELEEVCHVLNVPDIVPLPERFRSREIENFLKYGSYPDDFTSNQKSGLRGPAVQYTIIDDELYHNSNKKNNHGLKLVIHDDNPALKVKIMVESHLDEDGNHLGLNRTMQKVSEKYFWLGLSLDIRKFMLKCKICSQNRGKRLAEDTSRFSEEVKKLKERQVYQETGSSGDEVLTAYPVVNEDDANNENSEENYNQVYRLVGSDENDVTEITVKVVNGEVQGIQEGSQVFEIDEEQLAALEKEVTTTDKEKSEIDQINRTKENDKDESSDDTDGTDGEKSHIESDGLDKSGPEPGQTELEFTDKDIKKEHQCLEENTDKDVVAVEAAIDMLVNSTSEHYETETEDREMVQVKQEMTPQPAISQPSPLIQFYQDCVYVPRSKKTRAIENFLLYQTVTTGYTTSKLKELAENFIVEDGVLFRRASKYKGRQIVVHDDQPEIKLKIMQEHHKKPNGDHCSEMITFTNIQYKFYWEELRWDVNRFYKLCTTCVDSSGIEIKTNKRVLTVKELKDKEAEQRRKICELGVHAKRNRAFREVHKCKLDIFRSWEKYGKDMMEDVLTAEGDQEIAVTEGVQEEEVTTKDDCLVKEGTSMAEEDESDIDINLDEGSDDEGAKEEKLTLTVYATQKQEQSIREMFQERGWDYELESMTRCQGQSQTPEAEKLYEMLMMTTSEQDQAIQELFKSANKESEATSEGSKTLCQKEEILNTAGIKTKPESQISSKGSEALKTDKDRKPEQRASQKKTKAKDAVNKDTQNRTTVNRDTPNRTTVNKDTPNRTTVNRDTADQDTSEKDRVNKDRVNRDTSNKETSDRNTVNRDASSNEIVNKDEDSTKKELNKGKKQEIQELNTSISENRRPRREIKRPRRFSPDRMEEEQKSMSPRKTPKPAEKTKPGPGKDPTVNESQKQADQNSQRKGASSPRGRKPAKTADCPVTKSVEKSQAKSNLDGSLSKLEESQTRPRKSDESSIQLGQKRKAEPVKSSLKKDVSKTDVKGKQSTTGEAETLHVDIAPNKRRKLDNKDSIIDDNEISESDSKGIKDTFAIERENILNIYTDTDEDDEFYDDGSDDDEFSDDDDDHDDKNSVSSSDSAALEVLKTDKEFEMEVVNIDGLYMCSLCDAEFDREKDCKVHGLQNKCYVNCKTCGRMFRKNEKVELNKHMSLHETLDKFPCKSCNKVFSSSQLLEIHSLYHAGKKAEKCHLCSDTFYTSFQVASHLYRVHGESNLFNCDICKAKFVNLNFMQSEVLFDGILSYFKCVMCNK